VSGPRARTLATVSLALAALMTLLSLVGLGLVLYVAQVLLACRA
jgi:hypothetical protein